MTVSNHQQPIGGATDVSVIDLTVAAVGAVSPPPSDIVTCPPPLPPPFPPPATDIVIEANEDVKIRKFHPLQPSDSIEEFESDSEDSERHVLKPLNA